MEHNWPPGARFNNIVVENNDLDAHQIEAVLALDAELYPSTIYIGFRALLDEDGSILEENSPFDPIRAKEIFSLRGRDALNNSPGIFRTNEIDEKVGVPTIIRSENSGSVIVAGYHMRDSPKHANGRDKARKQSTKKSQGMKASKKHKRSAKVPKVIPPAAQETVRIQFDENTQIPSILISAVDKKDRAISTRLFADDLEYGNAASAEDDARVAFTICRYRIAENVDRTEPPDSRAHRGDEMLEKMSQDFQETCVVELSMTLNKSQRRWVGITDDELEMLRQQSLDASVAGNIVKLLENGGPIKLYFTCHASEEAIDSWTHFASSMRDLLTIAKVWGNFWFFRRQCPNVGDVEKSDLLNVKFVVPRWVVKSWQFKQITLPDGTVHLKEPTPHTWSSLDLPTYNILEPNLAAFMYKLGVEAECQRQFQDLRALMQSHTGVEEPRWFRGRFTSLNKKSTSYKVEVFLGLEHEQNTGRLVKPGSGTKISIKVNREQHQIAAQDNMVELRGTVQYDEFSSGATFVCVVHAAGLERIYDIADTDKEYPMFVSYLLDDTPYTRMLVALSVLQDGPITEFGPDFRGLILGCNNLTRNTDVLRKSLTPEKMQKFLDTLKRITPDFDDSQQEAAVLTCQSKTGNIAIHGPPGTGKTTVLKGVMHGHGALGHRIIATAPRNRAVQVLFDKFVEGNNALPVNEKFQDHEFVRFTGGQILIEKAKATESRRLESEESFARDNNKLLRDAHTRQNIPQYDQTFGAKLERRIKFWASRASNPQHEDAARYEELQLIIPDLSKDKKKEARDKKKEAKKELRKLEHSLSVAFLKEVKFLFCTVSTSGHPILQQSGAWDVLIIDEAACETVMGLSVPLAALQGRVKVCVWAGDPQQGERIVKSQGSNIAGSLIKRCLFAELVGGYGGGRAKHSEVVMLDTCYRMRASHIKWSSRQLYDGLVKSAPSTETFDLPLRNMINHVFRRRFQDVPENETRDFTDLGIDVTEKGIKDQLEDRTTTRFNEGEAKVVAQTVVDMLTCDPPTSEDAGDQLFRRIRGRDIAMIASYLGQVRVLEREFRQLATTAGVNPEDINDVWVTTSTNCKGKERPIVCYSLTIAPGCEQLPLDTTVAIGFVANVKNLNVALTRCRVARFTFGALKMFLHAEKIKHRIFKDKRSKGFFDFVYSLHETGNIIPLRHTRDWFEKGQRATNAGTIVSFRREDESKSDPQVSTQETRDIRRRADHKRRLTTRVDSLSHIQAPLR